MKKILLSILYILPGFFLIAQEANNPWPNAYSYTINKVAEIKNGAVVSAHPLASEVGVAILKNGGNAFDAAIATQLALSVVFPAAGNLGSGRFLMMPAAIDPTY